MKKSFPFQHETLTLVKLSSLVTLEINGRKSHNLCSLEVKFTLKKKGSVIVPELQDTFRELKILKWGCQSIEFIQWCNTDMSMWDFETSTWAVVTIGIRSSGISCYEAVKNSMPPNCGHILLTRESRIDLVADQKSWRTLPYEALAVSSRGKTRTETSEECKCNAWPTFWSWNNLGWSVKTG